MRLSSVLMGEPNRRNDHAHYFICIRGVEESILHLTQVLSTEAEEVFSDKWFFFHHVSGPEENLAFSCHCFECFSKDWLQFNNISVLVEHVLHRVDEGSTWVLIEVRYYLSQEVLDVGCEAGGQDSNAVLEQSHRTFTELLELRKFCKDTLDQLPQSIKYRAERMQLN